MVREGISVTKAVPGETTGAFGPSAGVIPEIMRANAMAATGAATAVIAAITAATAMAATGAITAVIAGTMAATATAGTGATKAVIAGSMGANAVGAGVRDGGSKALGEGRAGATMAAHHRASAAAGHGHPA